MMIRDFILSEKQHLKRGKEGSNWRLMPSILLISVSPYMERHLNQLLGDYGIINTGQYILFNTLWVTLPRKSPAISECPCDPITIRSY